MNEIKTGDTVLHGPTGEKWIVAVVYPDRGQLSWCGWPEGWAEIADCTLVKSCSDEDRVKLLGEMAGMQKRSDHRCRYAVEELKVEDWCRQTAMECHSVEDAVRSVLVHCGWVEHDDSTIMRADLKIGFSQDFFCRLRENDKPGTERQLCIETIKEIFEKDGCIQESRLLSKVWDKMKN